MANPLCGSKCSETLAAVKFSDTCPEINLSEIKRIFLTKPTAAAFKDYTTAAEWTTRLNQTGDAEGVIRSLTVIGDKPAASPITKDVSNNRKFVVGKDHTINFTVDDVTAENYEFMRTTECGGKFRVWYETSGGFIYGGNEGLLVNVQMEDVLGRGVDEIETLTGIITWRAKISPERAVSPIFQQG